MGKKRQRSTYVSKGQCGNINRWSVKAAQGDVPEVQKQINKWNAWKQGMNPWVTIPNPDPKNTKERMIRVRASEVWGDPKRFVNVMKEKVLS